MKKALGVYIFQGAFTEGVKQHFDVAGHLEGGDYGIETARLNNPKGFPIRYPETEWDVDRAFERKDNLAHDVDFLYGNPPCAIFSPMGIVTTKGATSWKEDPRLNCWKQLFRLLGEVKPKVWALESVCQAYTRGREIVDEFTLGALEQGYSVTHMLLDAKWTGIPQSRKRFFLVLHRAPLLQGWQFNYAPPPTIGETLEPFEENPGYFTVHTRADWPNLVHETPQGERLANTWERLNPGWNERRNAQGKVTGRPSFQDRRLMTDEVMGAWVGDKFYHPTVDRAIGLNEAKAICGYPADFKIAPKDLKQFGSLLARAVMPPVGAWLAKAAKATIETGDEGSLGELRVRRIDLRGNDANVVDITHEYLDKTTGRPIRTKKFYATNNEEIESDDESDRTGISEGAEEVRSGADVVGADRGPQGRAGEPEVSGRDHRGEEPLPGRVLHIVETSRQQGKTAAAVTGLLTSKKFATFVVDAGVEDPAAVIAKITGIDRDRVEQIALALGYADAATAAELTGIERALVDRVARCAATIFKQRVDEPVDLDVVEESPAGEPEAPPVAHASAESVIASEPAAPRTSGPTVETSRKRAVKPQVVNYEVKDSDPKPKDGEGSGVFIRRLLMGGSHTPEEIVALVLASYAGRKTTVKDVAWNWNKLRTDGANPPSWGGKTKPGSYPGQDKVSSGATRPAEEETAAGSKAPPPVPVAAVSSPAVILEPLPKPNGKTAIVEWYPRVCGSVAWGWHLSSNNPDLERITFSPSGRDLAGWTSPYPWKAFKTANAVDVLNDYDSVVLVDVACFAPEVNKKSERPYYESIVQKIRRPYTGMFHGGLYATKHDQILDAVFSGPGFSGSLITTRLAQAKARLAKWEKLKFVHDPYLPYDPSWAEGLDPKRKRYKGTLMTARIASNKGQNALLKIADALKHPVELYGYNAYGLPSIAYRLIELGKALGYDLVDGPHLRRDKSTLGHPNAPKFYTGAFEFKTPSGNAYRYHDGFDRLEDLSWAPCLHASLPSLSFGDTLEYVTLDAIAAGCVAVVPQTSVTEADYDSLILTEYTGCNLWTDDKTGGLKGAWEASEEGDLTKTINAWLKTSAEGLSYRAQLQRADVLPRHDPARVWTSVQRALEGKGK